MGDRGNIVVLQHGYGYGDGDAPDGAIYLYTHWRGSELPSLLATGLDRGRSRWTDEPYLTRIIFDALTGGDHETTGFGISTRLGDNEHPILVVDTDRQRVASRHEGGEIAVPVHEDEGWSFEEFLRTT
jgi:hypothetical protein